MSGWIKLHRSIGKSSISDHPEYFAVWIHLLIRAQHKPSEVLIGRTVVQLEAGQLVFGRKKFSVESGVSENKVRAALDVLKTLKQITIKSKTKYSIISITNWDMYQHESPPNNHETASKQPTDSQQIATFKNVENEKNEKKKPTTPKNKFSDDDLRCAEYMLESILRVQPDYKKPNIEKWADHVRLMRDRDSRTHREICEVWKWARLDSFWQQNILSPDKLRQKYDQLKAKMRAPTNGQQGSEPKSAIERFIKQNYSAPEHDERPVGGDDSFVWEQVD